ncbi:PTS sugar transporter subunit IIB, partial [Sharpea azabuensis]
MEDNYHTFRNQLENKTIKEFTKSIDKNKLTFESSYATGIISFNAHHIIEMEVINKKDAKSEFYIHFQYNNNAHALALYQEFQDALIQTKKKHTLSVLLCCSGGLTTSYFAMLLNEGAQAISLDYHFDAMSFDHLYHKGNNYDVILLAPQISYKHKEAESALRHKL